MARRLVDSPSEAEGMRQRLQQAVSVANWSTETIFRRLATKLDAEIPSVEALVIDDTGFPKKGKHSVGVIRQYSGTLGRIDNCQVATSLHLAADAASGCIGFRLFLPEEWAGDKKRRAEVGVPTEVRFLRKWELALELIDAALLWGVRKHVVLADAGYGDSTEFRDGLTERGLRFVVGICGSHTVWPPGAVPRLESSGGKRGRPRTRYQADGVEPWAIDELNAQIPPEEWRQVSWREGSRGTQRSRFAAVRVYSAERRTKGRAPGEEQWLLSEWPNDEKQPTKFWLSNLPRGLSLKALVRLAKLRWRVERDYQELKQEIGLDHFEGRTWRGFHHHAALCAAAHGFLALRRALFSPEETSVDALSSAPSPSGNPASMDWKVPAVQQARRPPKAPARSLSDVIRSD